MKTKQNIWVKSLILSVAMCVSGVLVAQPTWYVYDLRYEVKLSPDSGNTFQKTVDAYLERGMISPQMESAARARAQQQYEAWREGFLVQGEAAVMSTGSELSYSFPGTGDSAVQRKGFDWAAGRLKAAGTRFEVDHLAGDYPTSSALSWLFLGGKLNSNFVEVSRCLESRTVVFERPSPDSQFAGSLPGTIERVEVTFSDPNLTEWAEGRESLVLPNGQVLPGRLWEITGEFGTPGYTATARLFDANGFNWRTYEFEFLRTEPTGFTPASIPMGAIILDHRTPDGQPSLQYEWDGTFADVSQHAGGGFPVAGWYVLSALGFAALGVYFWRKR